EPVGWRDIAIVNGLDPTNEGVYLGALAPRETRLTKATQSLWARVAAHVAAANRLRTRLAESGRARPGTAEAILTPGGKVEHAAEAAQSNESRGRLIDAARTIERVRGSLRRSDPQQAVEEWKGLVAARWTLLDHFESDGRRYLLSRRNEAARDGLAGLTARE